MEQIRHNKMNISTTLFLRGLLLFTIFLGINAPLLAQSYANEWINFEQDYVKFKIDESGLYRINYETLATSGLPLEGSGFQLYFQGEQIPIFVSTSGILDTDDYIEFYAQTNNGSFDTQLFKQSNWQLSTHRSLFESAGTYFLTWSPEPTAWHYNLSNNDIEQMNPPLPYFMHTETQVYEEEYHAGVPTLLNGKHRNLANFEIGEGYISETIGTGDSRQFSFSTITAYTNADAPDASLTAKFLGRSSNPDLPIDHHIQVTLGGTTYMDFPYDGFDLVEVSNPAVAVDDFGLFSSFVNVTSVGDFSDTDDNALSFISLRYARKFDFENASEFHFNLPDNGNHYLEISNFNGGNSPVLYDISNGIKLLPVFEGGKHKIQLLSTFPGDGERPLVIANTNETVLKTVDNLTAVSFTNYAEQQGDYLLIADRGVSIGVVNNVQRYANYRNSEAGGSHQAVVAYSDELYDQFAYGIQQHPQAIRHFLRMAQNTWAIFPKNALLLGSSCTYDFNNANPEQACDLPAFGKLGSDQLYASLSNSSFVPSLNIGRVPATDNNELSYYLDKVIESETLLESAPCSKDGLWRKNVLQGTNADSLFSYLGNYKAILESGAWGAEVQFLSGIPSNSDWENIVENRVNLINYLGVANDEGDLLDAETVYFENGYYPIVCSFTNSFGNIQAEEGSPIMENYLLSEDKGAIAFLHNSNIEATDAVNTYLNQFYQNLGEDFYGETIGEWAKQTAADLETIGTEELKWISQTTTLLGDPALRLTTATQADFVIEEEDVQFWNTDIGALPNDAPIDAIVSADLDEYTIFTTITNTGRALQDSVTLRIRQLLPDGNFITVSNRRMLAPVYETTIAVLVDNQLQNSEGINTFIIWIDQDNELEESCEINNAVSKTVDITPTCTSEDGFPVVDLAQSIIEINEGGFPIELDAGDDGFTYLWSNGATSSVIEVEETGVYSVTVTTNEGCQVIDEAEIYFTGIDDNKPRKPELSISPNPAKDVVQLQTSKNPNGGIYHPQVLQIWDAMGRLVKTMPLNTTNPSISVGDLPQGTYWLRLFDGEDVFFGEVVVGN